MAKQKFNCLLDPQDYVMLSALESSLHLSKGQVIRELIRWRHEMQLEARPTCANGKPCLVAHMHLSQTTMATCVRAPLTSSMGVAIISK